jgi:hypothetical protein
MTDTPANDNTAPLQTVPNQSEPISLELKLTPVELNNLRDYWNLMVNSLDQKVATFYAQKLILPILGQCEWLVKKK